MIYEILDCIEDRTSGYEDIYIDCIKYLKTNLNNKEDQYILEDRLYNLHRCPKCTNLLSSQFDRELHLEVDTQQYEIRTYDLCPQCGWRSDQNE